MDTDTATFLQEKATNIVKTEMMSRYSIGKELKEAQAKLSSRGTGTFGQWCQSFGFSKTSAYEYIRFYDWVCTRPRTNDQIENVEKLPWELLRSVSSKNAPAELQKAVLDGDITTNKEYQEALKAKAEAEQEAKKANEEKEHAEFEAKENCSI